MYKDFLIAVKNIDLWLYMSWYDIVSKYRRTTLGPLWSIIITFISIVCMSVVGALLFKVNLREFLPYVAAGMVTWSYVTYIINDSCSIFIHQTWALQNVKLPILSFSLRLFMRNTILYLHSLAILLVVLLFCSTLNLKFLWIFPSFIIMGVNAFCISIILGFFSARYRDVMYMVQSLLNILVLLTPLMWKVEMLGEYSYLALINPFTHYIALFRDPLLGNGINSLSLSYVLVLTVINFLIAYYLYSRFKNRMVFWL